MDPESGQTIISGMGELHLEIYVERMKREYKVGGWVGRPYCRGALPSVGVQCRRARGGRGGGAVQWEMYVERSKRESRCAWCCRTFCSPVLVSVPWCRWCAAVTRPR